MASLVKGWADISDLYVRTVPVSTLDHTLGNRFEGKRCLVLVDIEGAEKNMLEGARRFLGLTPKPVWLVEIWITRFYPGKTKMNPNLLSTFQIFWDAGYEAWVAKRKPRLIPRDEIKAICESGQNTLDTHNFLFIETGKLSEYLCAP
jgi:hypothetical protein